MQTQKLILVSAALFLISACAEKKDTATGGSTTPTDGSQSMAQLAGTGQFCATNASLGGTYAYTRSLTLTASGTYSYNLYFSDNTTCSTASTGGGNNIANYTQTGTYTVNGTAGTPSTGTKVTFSVGTVTLLIRAGTYGSIPQSLATWMNSNCTPNPAFSTSANSTKNPSGNSCSSSGSYAGVNLPAVGDTYGNVIYNSGGILTSGVSTGQDLWRTGGSTYPTTYTQNYLGWQ